MSETQHEHRIREYLDFDTFLLTWIEGFLIDRKAQGLSPRTLDFYREKLRLFTGYCENQVITQISALSPNTIRQYMLFLEDKGHNPGGIHAAYRALRAFLYWYEEETEPENWSNPIRKVHAPKVDVAPLEPVHNSTVRALLSTCDHKTFTGARDRGILLFLMDSGVRAGELLATNIDDLDLVLGSVLIRKGKGGKPRTVHIGRHTRKALRSYLRSRKDQCQALWVTQEGFRLRYSGLRSLVCRRARQAGVEAPTLHSFRRAFALTMLRNGTDIFTLAKLMGHASIAVLQAYLKQTTEDTQAAHRKSGPVDRLL